MNKQRGAAVGVGSGSLNTWQHSSQINLTLSFLFPKPLGTTLTNGVAAVFHKFGVQPGPRCAVYLRAEHEGLLL